MEAPWRPPGPHFGPPGPPSGTSVRLFSLIFDQCLSCVAARVVRFRLRVRLRFGFCKLKMKVGSPRSLKPWLAAGGREAIKMTITKKYRHISAGGDITLLH